MIRSISKPVPLVRDKRKNGIKSKFLNKSGLEFQPYKIWNLVFGDILTIVNTTITLH